MAYCTSTTPILQRGFYRSKKNWLLKGMQLANGGARPPGPRKASLTPRRLHPAPPARKGLVARDCAQLLPVWLRQGFRGRQAGSQQPRCMGVAGGTRGEPWPRRTPARSTLFTPMHGSLNSYHTRQRVSGKFKHQACEVITDNFKRGLMLLGKHKHNSLSLREIKYLHWEKFKTIV